MTLSQHIFVDRYEPTTKEQVLKKRMADALANVKEKFPDIDWEDTDNCFDEFCLKYDGEDDFVNEYQDSVFFCTNSLADDFLTELLTDDVNFNDLHQFIMARVWCEEYFKNHKDVDNPSLNVASLAWRELDDKEKSAFVVKYNRAQIPISEETAKELYETCKNDSWDDLLAKYNMRFSFSGWGEIGLDYMREDFNERFIGMYEWWVEFRGMFPYMVYEPIWRE